ncbi:MAG TPA: DUF2339 domain-containing protein [Gemmatimonadaceae bacterium]|nr:DUF2339 domain-containing protein [Gemmatimonadaceae bacterium]
MSDATPPTPDETAARLARLEATVAALAREVATLRTAARAGAAHTAAPPVAPSGTPVRHWSDPTPPMPPASRDVAPPDRPSRRRTFLEAGLDVETLVGRYGTMALAALTIILGVGAFLGWAIQRVRLGPGLRVALGALAAVGVAGLGLWLRERGTRRFGNVLLALALAITHVVAWGAGPALGVVPPAVALGVAALASAALAALAWHDGSELLFAVGTGGALLAPFVTARAEGDPVILLLYGWVVLTAAAAALRAQRWSVAARLLVAGALAYTGAALEATWSTGLLGGVAWAKRDLPALFPLASALGALAVAGPRFRSSLARAYVVVLLVPLFARTALVVGDHLFGDLVAIAGAGAATVYLALRWRDTEQPWAMASAVGQPLALLGVALLALPERYGLAPALVALGAAALALLAALDAGALVLAGAPTTAAEDERGSAVAEPLWSGHLLVVGLASALAITLGLHWWPVAAAALLAAHGAGAALLARRMDRPLLLVTPLVALLGASAWVGDLLDARPAYAYRPFLTLPSLAALVLVAAWWTAGRHAARVVRAPAAGATERALLGALGGVALFLWGYAELARAVAPETAAFLVIVYVAASGVLVIQLGRRWAMAGGRRVGLALAVYAALRAIVQASDFASIGLRVGSYLLVGGFLLAVAYWYRAAGEAVPAE